MRWNRFMPLLVCGGLALGCASAAAQDDPEPEPTAAEDRRRAEEEQRAREGHARSLEMLERLEAMERLEKERAELARSRLPELRAALHRAQVEIESLARLREKTMVELQVHLRTLAERRARVTAKSEALERQGYGEKDPKREELTDQLRSLANELATLEREKVQRERDFDQEMNSREARVADVRTAFAEAEAGLERVSAELAEHRARLDESPFDGGVATGGGAGGRFPRRAEPAPPVADAPFSRGRAPRGDVDRRIEGLERAVRELHALLERHGIDRRVRERAERRMGDRRRGGMPRFDLTEEEARRLRERVDFDALRWYRGEPGRRPPAPRGPQPPLEDAGDRIGPEWLRSWVKRPADPERTGLSKEETEEMRRMAKRMLELLEKGRREAPPGRRPPPDDRPPEPGPKPGTEPGRRR